MLSSVRNPKVKAVLNLAKTSSCGSSLSSNISKNEFSMRDFDYTVNILRNFFRRKGWREVHMQHRRSIMAACEDPWTIVPYRFERTKWPLPQTSQMWLEHELLTNPDVPGIYTLSTSYRHEPQPMSGRHEMIFPMFEFEGKGNYKDLKNLLGELLDSFGLARNVGRKNINYDEACWLLNTDIIEARDEKTLGKLLGSDVYCINRFPETTSPFWNMKRERSFVFQVDENKKRCVSSETFALKTDVIIAGHETIGCAERETDRDMMRERFETISDGNYAKKIRSEFGHERVDQELEEFLGLDFFPRYGGGIGMHRLINGMKNLGIFNTPDFSSVI